MLISYRYFFRKVLNYNRHFLMLLRTFIDMLILGLTVVAVALIFAMFGVYYRGRESIMADIESRGYLEEYEKYRDAIFDVKLELEIVAIIWYVVFALIVVVGLKAAKTPYVAGSGIVFLVAVFGSIATVIVFIRTYPPKYFK